MSTALAAVIMAGGLEAASITYVTSEVGPSPGGIVYRHVFDFSMVPLMLNQELNLRFDPGIYQTLSNGVAPAGYDLLLFQPNSPQGAEGAYSLLALVNQPAPTGMFSVDFTLFSGSSPNGLRFSVNQLDANGGLLDTVALGLTNVPEPNTWWFGCGAAFFAGLMKLYRRRS
ncbi:MAG: hypothetical protein K2X03_00220 [Bryobacteraceae bacterium]|nr:hypothetical protein [Bryobacteraceae bacterium]